MATYNVSLEFKKPNGNGGNKWFLNIQATSSASAEKIALNEAKSLNSDYT